MPASWRVEISSINFCSFGGQCTSELILSGKLTIWGQCDKYSNFSHEQRSVNLPINYLIAPVFSLKHQVTWVMLLARWWRFCHSILYLVSGLASYWAGCSVAHLLAFSGKLLWIQDQYHGVLWIPLYTHLHYILLYHWAFCCDRLYAIIHRVKTYFQPLSSCQATLSP